MGVFGIALFAALFAPEDLRRTLSPPLRKGAVGLAVFALVSAFGWLALEAAEMGGDPARAFDPTTLSDVLTLTAFGDVWQARLILGVALVAAVAITPAHRWGFIALISGALVASLGLVGHSAMQTGLIGLAHRANDAAHLICAAAWLGGLAPFLLCLWTVERENSRADSILAMMRFSAAGHFNVLLIVATGALNIALTTHALPWPPSSPYRALLLAKLAVVGAMIATALFNRYVLVPRATSGSPALKALRWTSLGEIALAALVIALVSGFGTLDPA